MTPAFLTSPPAVAAPPMDYVWAIVAALLCVFSITTALLLRALKKAEARALLRENDSRSNTAAEQEALLQVFFKDAPVSLAMFDRDVNYVAYSTKWLHDSGLGDIDITGRNHYELFPDYLRDNPDARNTVQRILNGETVINDKLRVTRADGGCDYIRYEGRPWRNLKGEVAGIISFRESIASRLKTEDELRRYAREVEQFAYIASHDLKAPLRGIDNLAKWIAEDMAGVMTPEVKENFAMLHSRVTRLETLLDDILRYSRAGHVVEEARSIDTFELISTITKLNPWGENFEIKCEGMMPVLTSPRTPLEQIFTNLITNAIKHHDRKNGKVTIKANQFRDHVEFIVQDDGPGIPPEFHERVFGLFQTLKPRDKVEGSGLGMAIIKKLIEWQDGRVWVESDGKRGTCIHFEWPRTPVERKEKHAG